VPERGRVAYTGAGSETGTVPTSGASRSIVRTVALSTSVGFTRVMLPVIFPISSWCSKSVTARRPIPGLLPP